jgi:PAS domain S-box-containing protein
MNEAAGSQADVSGEAMPASILLVDDRRDNLLALEAILGDSGYDLVSATSGREALGLALRQDFAAVLLDVFMPEMDGYEVASHLKGVERTRHIPIIFLTANATEVEHIYQAYSVGAVDYLIKPLDPDVVRKKVEVFVDLYRQRQQIERQARLLLEAERREHQLRLAELRIASDRRYRKLVEGIDHVMAWSADPQTLQLTFISRQAEEILGYSIEQLSEPDFFLEHVHPEDRGLVISTVRQAASEGADKDCNHRMFGAGGRMLWFHTAVSVTPVETGGAEAHGVSVEVTHLKRSEQNQRLLAGASSVLAECLDDPQAMQRLAHMLVPEVADCCLIDAVTEAGELERVGAAHAQPTGGEIRSGLDRPVLSGVEGPTDAPWIARVFRTGDARSTPGFPIRAR